MNKKQGRMGASNIKYQNKGFSSNGYGNSIKMKEPYGKWRLPKSKEESITRLTKLLTQNMGIMFGNVYEVCGMTLLETEILVGNGGKTLIWHDPWIGHSPLNISGSL